MTEPNMEWEEEFDERFVFRYMASLEREDEMQSSADPNEIKAFIRKVETRSYEKGKAEERERIAEAVKDERLNEMDSWDVSSKKILSLIHDNK